MKVVFIAYNNKDKILTRVIYMRLVEEQWPGVEIFMDEFSVRPGEDFKEKCVSKARVANLGIIILSEYTQKSEFVPQEAGILLAKDIPKIYVALHEDWKIPPGYEKTIKSFPLYEGNPYEALERLVLIVRELLELGPHIEDTEFGILRHPIGTEKERGQLFPCSFLISPTYQSDPLDRWQELADIEVVFPQGNPLGTRHVYLIPSGLATPLFRHSIRLRSEPSLLAHKRQTSKKFADEKRGRELKGFWFGMRKGEVEIAAVYCPAYDAFLNSSLKEYLHGR